METYIPICDICGNLGDEQTAPFCSTCNDRIIKSEIFTSIHLSNRCPNSIEIAEYFDVPLHIADKIYFIMM